MPAQRQRDRPKVPGGETAEALARRLSDAVRLGANGKGPDRRNGNDPIAVPSAREIAIDVCSAILAETSGGTAEHSSDVVLITEAIGERMGIEGKGVADLLAAARLHDIGKAWVPSRILEKPGPLMDDEWEVMRQHTVVGERILSSVAELQEVARLVRHSHERWDGGGYPDRLAGSEIPLGSRIIFCADAFHAIRCDRPYREGRSAREAVAEINRCAGTQFDPQVAAALEQVVRERNRRPRAAGGSSRLFALLMCLVIGGAGTAVARSGLLQEPTGTASTASKPPPGCGTAACPTVAGPVGGLGAVGALNGIPGPRPLQPGLPGHKRGHGKRGAGKSSGTHGKSAAAKQRHAEKSNGKHKGQSGESHGNSEAAHSQSTAAPSSSSRGGGGSSHSTGGHHSSASHSSGHGASSHGHSRGGSSNGNAGGNGNGNGHG